jgi:hypothetical protein
MKVYLVLEHNDENDRCWDCGETFDNSEYYRIIGVYVDEKKAEIKLGELRARRSDRSFEIQSYDVEE